MKRIIEVNLVLGAWLILSPYILAFATGHSVAVSNDVAIGVLVLGCSLWAIAPAAPRLYLAACEGFCGAWLLVAPFALHERRLMHASANNMVVGAVVLLVSLGETWMLAGRSHRPA